MSNFVLGDIWHTRDIDYYRGRVALGFGLDREYDLSWWGIAVFDCPLPDFGRGFL